MTLSTLKFYLNMKNKKEVEREDRKRHIEQKRAAKLRRRGEPVLVRNEPTKDLKPVILIVCEGTNTEPSYFRQFKLSTASIKPVGKGANTISLVRAAIDLRANGKYEEVWCVFDKDDFEAHDFNGAITLALQQGLNVAYSNQAFEYWLILHFEDHQGGQMQRTDYHKKINEYLEEHKIFYDGKDSKVVSKDFFELMLSKDLKTGQKRIDLAIKRAGRNYGNFDHASPATEESTTTVFELVQKILKHT